MQDVLVLLVNLIKDVSVIMVIAYLLSRTPVFAAMLEGKLSQEQKFGIILVFGLFSIFGTLGGVHIPGGIINVRDLGPTIAGFLAGPAAGLGAGLIGAIHRYSLGGPTVLGCSLSTLVAGLAAGWVWVYRSGKFPGVVTAAAIMALLESVHMGLNLLIGGSDPEVFNVVRQASLPMIVANSMGMAVFALILNNLIKERKTEAEKEFIEGELKVARTIQMSLIPKIFPAFPERPEFDLYAVLEPAREVGGDLYDFYLSPDGFLYFTVGDVSGKGVPASLFMAVTRTLLRARFIESKQPEKILAAVNAELCLDNDSGMFVTQFLGILDINNGNVYFSNAGHNLPFILRSNGKVEMLPKLSGMAMGVIEDVKYSRSSFQLFQGDILLVYTDGITEAVNIDNELFGDSRLSHVLGNSPAIPPRELGGQIIDAVNEFAGSAEQADDITILVLKYTGSTKLMRLNLSNDLTELEQLAESLALFAKINSLSKKDIYHINLALDELLTNTISYAFSSGEKHRIEITLCLDKESVLVEMRDDGIPFNPLNSPEPDTGLAIEERSIGGLGIHFVRNLMDSIEYYRQGNSNILKLKKKLEGEAEEN